VSGGEGREQPDWQGEEARAPQTNSSHALELA
jgi:hypothetical protein